MQYASGRLLFRRARRPAHHDFYKRAFGKLEALAEVEKAGTAAVTAHRE